MKRPRRIVAAVDLSGASERVVAAASLMAKAFDAVVHVVHVREAFTFPTTGGDVPVPGQERLAEDVVDATLSRIAERLTADGVVPVTTSLNGSAAAAIIDHADDIGAELIVVGTHGRGGAAHLLLGSVAERIVQRAARPVLVVPAR